MRVIQCVLLVAIVAMFASCASDGKKMTPSGFEYIVHKKGTGEKPNPTDWSSFTIKMVGDNGKVLQEMGEGPNMPAVQIPAEDAKDGKPNPILDVLTDANVGDSISIIIPVDSMPASTPEIKEMQHINYVISVKDVSTDEERKAALEKKRAAAEAKAAVLKEREPAIADFIKTTLASYKAGKENVIQKDGIEIIIHEEGSGKVAEDGTRPSMQYYGVLKSDGTEFDNSFKRGRAFDFTLGRGEVIKGWDVGVKGLKKGAKATLIIPYTLAYGEAERPGMPGKSDLVFYVEVEDIN